MYVILGATGNTGKAAVEALLAKGEKVRAVARDASKIAQKFGASVEAFAADAKDATALTKAFTGAAAAYVMIPPQISAPDFLEAGDKISDAITEAVKASGISHVVLLSSIGAQHEAKTGPIVGLHRFERKLAAVSGLNAVLLRPPFFMENFLMAIGLIHSMGFIGNGIKDDMRMPMIAAGDIGRKAAEYLAARDFSGVQVRGLLGPCDYTQEEAARILGAEIGKPKLSYQRFPSFLVEQALKQMGLPAKTAALMSEMNDAFNDGLLNPLEPRSEKNTTPTTLETFAKEVFAPAYKAKAANA
jgi:uncharacterized protein YbjT (DUF2867 family)